MASSQMQILQALIEADDPEAIPILIDCLGSSHHATVRFAAESIGEMAKKQKYICNMAVSELVDALASENAQIRKSVLNTLLLLDIPLCYSSAINNIVRGDNQPYNKTLAKKIIQNIISNDSSIKYDNYSGPSNTCKQSAVLHKFDNNTSSKTVEPYLQFDQGIVKNISAVMPDDVGFYDFRDSLKFDYPSKYSQTDSSEEPNPSCEVTAIDKLDAAFRRTQDDAIEYERTGAVPSAYGRTRDIAKELLVLNGYSDTADYNVNALALKISKADVMKDLLLKHPFSVGDGTITSKQYKAICSALEQVSTVGRNNGKPVATVDNKKSVEEGFDHDLSGDCDVKNENSEAAQADSSVTPYPSSKVALLDKLDAAFRRTQDNAIEYERTGVGSFSYGRTRDVAKGLLLLNGYSDTADYKINALILKNCKADVMKSMLLKHPFSVGDGTVTDKKYKAICSALEQLSAVGRTNGKSVLACATVDNEKSVKEGFGHDLSGDCDVKNENLISPLTFEELLALDRPAEHISEEMWKAWCHSIEKSPIASVKVIKVAKKHGLCWENQFIRFSRYLNYSLHDIKNFYGFNNKKVRTLILCVASLNMSPNPSKDTPLSNVPLTDEKKLSSLPHENSDLAANSLDDYASFNQDCADNSDGVMGVFDCEFSDKLAMDDHCNEIMQSHDTEEIIPAAIGPRARRTVHLHQILNLEGSFLTLHDLIERHNDEYSNERCSTRDADLVMRDSPHLFVMLGDKGWCSIGSYPADKNYRFEPSITDNDAIQQTGPVETADDSNITSIITAILRNRGLSNFMDVVTEFQNIVGNTYSAHSIGPTLLMWDDFIKFAPNIYGLREHLKGFGVSTSDLLLNDHDCQLFIMARYAGENFGSFRLWNPVMEYKWYQWLEKRSNEKLRESFYFIATPEEWPVHDKQAAELKHKIEQKADAYYFLREPKYVGSSLPDIRSIYALIRYVKDNGSINWIAANLVLERRIDEYHTAVDIAFLVCFGAVEPAHNWQRLHKAKEDAGEIERKLSMMLNCGQANDWRSPAGMYLLDIYTININLDDMGWVEVSELNKLFHNTRQNTILISEETLTAESHTQDVEILPKECNAHIPDTVSPDEDSGSLLPALKAAMNPENLISDCTWLDWSQRLNNLDFASQLISAVAGKNGLSWPVTKEFETFDKYLGLPLNKIFKLLGWKNNRTLLLCVANAALNISQKIEPTYDTGNAETNFSDSIEEYNEVSFEELYRSDNPAALLSSEIWDNWTNLLLENDARTLLISDIVDDLGSLFWQARWKNEKVFDYCIHSLDDIRKIDFPGKNRTIVICIAKAATDALAKINCSSNKDNFEINSLTANPESKAIPNKLKYNDSSFDFMLDKHLEKDSNNKKIKIIDSIIEDFF